MLTYFETVWLGFLAQGFRIQDSPSWEGMSGFGDLCSPQVTKESFRHKESFPRG